MVVLVEILQLAFSCGCAMLMIFDGLLYDYFVAIALLLSVACCGYDIKLTQIDDFISFGYVREPIIMHCLYCDIAGCILKLDAQK